MCPYRRRLLLPALAPLLASLPAVSGALTIRRVRPSAEVVGRFGRLELDIDATGQWDNPFDPDQVDLGAEFTAPSGRNHRVPAFPYQSHNVTTIRPEDARKQVRFVKFYLEEKAWRAHSRVEFFLDDIELLDSRTGAAQSLADFESGRLDHWGVPEWITLSSETVHGGQWALKLTAPIEGNEDWPGAVRGMQGADWSGYDGISLWVYPRVEGRLGEVSLYFQDEQKGVSPIRKWRAEELQANTWNHLTWSWADFAERHVWELTGQPSWKIRFTPVETGNYSVRVGGRDREGAAPDVTLRFRCRPSDRPGFVRVSTQDPRYFAFDNGRPFLPIGHDVAWGVEDAFAIFPRMAAHGENCTYFIMVPWETAIEWGKLGEYDLLAAARLDRLVECAETNGIYLKLSFDIHDALRPSAAWGRNPYAAANGGPCAGPNDFYREPVARRLYQRRLRYIAARWGYSPAIMGWEPFAEIDGATELDGREGWAYPSKPAGEAVSTMLQAWLREVHEVLAEFDPYSRLFTTSFGSDVSDPNLWHMPEVDYTQIHHYDSIDLGGTMTQWCRRMSAGYAKPMMVTEFAWYADWTRPVHDKTGVCIHNGIWASLLSGAAGSAMSWWWQRIDEENLYPHYQTLRRFTEGVAFPREAFQPIEAEVTLPAPDHFVPVTIPARAPFTGAAVSEFVVAADGTTNDPDQVTSFLMAPGRPEPRVSPTFMVDCPMDAEFVVHVDRVSPDARLDAYVDEALVLSRPLPARDVPGKLSTYSERHQVWECLYDEDVNVPLPPGRHRIRVENGEPGFSWLHVTSYGLTRYALPSLRVVGLRGQHHTLLWVQNRESTWVNADRGRSPQAIAGAQVQIAELPPGTYSVEWWDTWTGERLPLERVAASEPGLTLRVPPVIRDLACRISHR